MQRDGLFMAGCCPTRSYPEADFQMGIPHSEESPLRPNKGPFITPPSNASQSLIALLLPPQSPTAPNNAGAPNSPTFAFDFWK